MSDRPCVKSEFEFDLSIYRLSAIKKAAYRFSGQFTVQIESIAPSRVRVLFSPRPSSSGAFQDLSGFPSEVLDQELREVVADETKSVRDILLAQTFSGLALVDPVGEVGDYHDDPLGIGSLPADRGIK